MWIRRIRKPALEGKAGQHHSPAVLTPVKDRVNIVQEAGWASGPVWTARKISLLTSLATLT